MKNTVKIFVCLVFLTICNLSYSQTTYYVLNKSDEIRLQIDNTSNVYELSGPGLKLTFEAYKNARTAINNLYVNTSVDKITWVEKVFTIKVEDLNYNSYKEFNFNLDNSVRYLKFHNVGSYSRYIRNVKVTRATTLSSNTSSIDFGEVVKNQTKESSITVEFNNTYSDAVLTGNCTNSAFKVTQESMGETGSKAITIKFTPTTAGIQEGTVTLTMGTQGKSNNVTYEFSVSGKGISGDMYPDNVSGYSPGTYSNATLYRTIPAGFSTVALPFSTTIDALAGSGNGKAYTLQSVGYDENLGYKFYFAEVTSLEAGKPYLIKLTNQVVNPVWDNVTVGALTPVTITRGGWDFTANFTPDKNMNGCYGVVNLQSKIMKGGKSSKINAFGAYFQLNQAVSSSSKTSSSEDNPISDSQQRMTIILQ